MIKLSTAEIKNAKDYLRALFYAGGVSSRRWSGFQHFEDTKAAAKKICTEIVNRSFDFIKNKLDDCLNNLAYYKFRTSSYGDIKRSAQEQARYIAWFCYTNDIIWDDSSVTSYELDAIKQTILGGTLYNAGCFASNGDQPKATPQKTANPAANKANGQAPVNGYKSSGGHSQDVPNIIKDAGNTITKTYLTGKVYCITADKTGKNTPSAYITPLKTTNTSIVQISKADAEVIKFGSGNGYTDCALFFDDIVDAQNIATFCENKFGAKFSNIKVCGVKKADTNGYFKVSTEAGNAYIKATPLNEEIDTENKPYENSSKNFKITDVDLYDEWSRRSIS